MFKVKIAYDDSCPQLYNQYNGLPQFEFFNESYSDEKKKAWKLKNQFGAKQLPFAAMYDGNELITTIWAENSANVKEDLEKAIRHYLETHAKTGIISIKKVSGKIDNEYSITGICKYFIEGVGCYVISPTTYYHTSVVTKIDWENNLFYTLNSTYKFNFIEDESTSNQENAE